MRYQRHGYLNDKCRHNMNAPNLLASGINGENLWVERLGKTEENWTIACGSRIKDDAGFWRHAQILPADLETKRFSLVLNLGERASAVCADLWNRTHRQLIQFSVVVPRR